LPHLLATPIEEMWGSANLAFKLCPMLTQGAIVLLITDGLKRDADDTLAFEIDRLHRSCRRLIWLNPLLGSEGYEPLTQGMQAALPHVDDFLPVHNLESLEQLGEKLSALGGGRPERPCPRWS